jgi:hypothetical protein
VYDYEAAIRDVRKSTVGRRLKIAVGGHLPEVVRCEGNFQPVAGKSLDCGGGWTSTGSDVEKRTDSVGVDCMGVCSEPRDVYCLVYPNSKPDFRDLLFSSWTQGLFSECVSRLVRSFLGFNRPSGHSKAHSVVLGCAVV